MGLGTIPDRANGQTIDETWFNLLKTVLKQAVVPRDTNGIVGDLAGDLGSATNRWLGAYIKALKLIQDAGGNTLTLQSPAALAASYSLTMPAALPGSTLPLTLSNAGILLAAQIVAAQIASGTITTTQISATAGILGSQLADATISRSKMVATSLQVSSSCGTFTSIAATFGDVTNLSVTITTTGGPVMIKLIPDGSANDASMRESSSALAFLQLMRDGVRIAGQRTDNGGNLPLAFQYVEAIAAGTYVYKFQAKGDGVGSLLIQYMKMIAYEMV